MIATRLAIPLSVNPARQQLWRAIGAVSLTLGCLLLGYLLNRAILTRSSAHSWPVTATAEIRVIKTPQTATLLQAQFGHYQLLPGTPWTVSDALSWTQRELIVFIQNDAIIGLSVDGKLPESVYASLDNFDLSASQTGQRTHLLPNHTVLSDHKLWHTSFWLLWPVFDGEVVTRYSDQIVSLPFSLNTDQFDLRVNMAAYSPSSHHLVLPENTRHLGSFTLPSTLTTALIPATPNANFPGLQLLAGKLANQPLDILVGQDAKGISLAVSAATSGFTLEELGTIASETVGFQNLSTLALTKDSFPNSLEIHSVGDVNVNLENSNGLAIAVAENQNQDIFRLSQTPSQLIMSNRPAQISQTVARNPNTCLRNPDGFIEPKQLVNALPWPLDSRLQVLSEVSLTAEMIAFKLHHVRFCW